MRKYGWLTVIACVGTAAAVTAATPAAPTASAGLTEADAKYYGDFASDAKDIGKILDRLGELIAKASSGKSYAAECEDKAAALADRYHDLETRVPPAEGLTAHKDLMTSAEFGADAALELASYYKAEFEHKEKLNKAMELYEQAVNKYTAAMAATPIIGGTP